MLSGLNANNQAAGAAKSDQANEKALISRITKLFDTQMGAYQKADAAGQFDPTKAIQTLENDTSRYESRDGGNTAAAYRAAGYQPGDTPETQALQDVKVKYRGQFNDMAQQIRDSKGMQRFQVLSGINPSSLGTGIAAYGQMGQQAMGQIQNPAGLFSATMPFFNQSPAVKLPKTTYNYAGTGQGTY